MNLHQDLLEEMLSHAGERLIQSRQEGHWVGCLSSSALATATAAFALARLDRPAHAARVDRALAWLAGHQNGDGGWGDSPISPSNLSTTVLGWSAFCLAPAHPAAARAEGWLMRRVGSLSAEALAAAVNEAYGRDRTFSAPILTMCALAGRLGAPPACWRHVARLPFELGVLPHRWLRRLRLPVVSYALPALIAIGRLREQAAPSPCPLTRALRRWAGPGAMRRLAEIQPPGGGFLEAAPLTSFVSMSLAAMGLERHPAAERAAEFLISNVRGDGSWPIDTDLATWTTTLSVDALASAGRLDALGGQGQQAIRQWLLAQQVRREHPYTGAAPGGWAWTDLPGGVPDADDTAGALVALHSLGGQADGAVQAALGWLADLQNADGGIPTFCRGWGHLPFDRSAPDLTAHAMRAWRAWRDRLPPRLAGRLGRCLNRAAAYLRRAQRADGAWLPLWFGNQASPDQANPTYGTARVMDALSLRPAEQADGQEALMLDRGAEWLLSSQGADGGWGGDAGLPPSIEETSLALGALAGWRAGPSAAEAMAARTAQAIHRAIAWLAERTGCGRRTGPAAIGLYFARLWYFEELYPLIFLVWALGRARRPCHTWPTRPRYG